MRKWTNRVVRKDLTRSKLSSMKCSKMCRKSLTGRSISKQRKPTIVWASVIKLYAFWATRYKTALTTSSGKCGSSQHASNSVLVSTSVRERSLNAAATKCRQSKCLWLCLNTLSTLRCAHSLSVHVRSCNTPNASPKLSGKLILKLCFSRFVVVASRWQRI